MATAPTSFFRTLGRFVLALLLIAAAVIGGVVAATLIASQERISAEDIEPARGRVPVDGRTRSIAPREGDRVLRGTVVASDGRPLAGASVRVTAAFVDDEVATNEQGRFTLERLPAAPAAVVALAAGYRPLYLAPVALDGKDLTLTLVPIEHLGASRPSTATGSIVATVTTAGTARPPRLTIAAMPLVLDGRGAIVLPRTVNLETPNATVVRLDALPAAHYRLLAVPLGASIDRRFALGEIADVDVAAGSEQKLELLVRWGVVTGRVTSEGAPVERAFVRAARRAENARGTDAPDVELKRTTTDREGAFLLGELPLGATTLEVHVAMHQTWSKTIDVGASNDPIDVKLTRLPR